MVRARGENPNCLLSNLKDYDRVLVHLLQGLSKGPDAILHGYARIWFIDLVEPIVVVAKSIRVNGSR